MDALRKQMEERLEKLKAERAKLIEEANKTLYGYEVAIAELDALLHPEKYKPAEKAPAGEEPTAEEPEAMPE